MFITRDNIKVSFDKPKFQTTGNEITCTLNYRILVPEMVEHTSPYVTNDTVRNTDNSDVVTCFELGTCLKSVGRAVCSENDEFSKKTGREIAAARAESKAYKHAEYLLKKYLKTVITRYNDMLLAFEAKSDAVQRHNKEFAAERGK